MPSIADIGKQLLDLVPVQGKLQDDAPYRQENKYWRITLPYALSVVNAEKSNSIGSVLSKLGGFDNASLAGKTVSGAKGATPGTVFFPVNPESLTISTPFAAVATPTVGGVVEEHSGAVFYNITIRGNTGVIPGISYLNGTLISALSNPKSLLQQGLDVVRGVGSGAVAGAPTGRPNAATAPLVSPNALGGFGQNTIDQANSIAKGVQSLFGGEKGPIAKENTAQTGYEAIHEIYRLLWRYHELKRQGAALQLRFVNFKDGNMYDCLVENFTVSRDKSRPHLYSYTIQLKGWNIKGSKTPASIIADVSGEARLAALGVSGEASAKAKIFRAINGAKGILNGSRGLMNAVANDLRF